MLKQRLAAADAVRSDYLPAKAGTADAMARMIQLLATFNQQHTAAGLRLGTGIKVQRLIAEATTLQVRAHELMVEAHPMLRELITDIGIRNYFGGDDSYPEKAELEPEIPAAA